MNQNSEPLRLLRRRGQWRLEVTKLVAIDHHVLRPERRSVVGTDHVVRQLKDRCEPTLVREALDLIVAEDDGCDRAFELSGERWVQLGEVDEDSSGQRRISALAATVAELRAELLALRALHDALRSRISSVERRAQTQASLPTPPRVARRESLAASRHPSSKPRSEAPPAQAAALAALGNEPTRVAQASSACSVEDSSPALNVPELSDITLCLKQLLGADPELRAESSNVPSELSDLYVARVMDAEQRELGAIVVDRRGTVDLGGKLLGFPPSAIEEQMNDEPSVDVLDAMNEVVNNLGGFVNRANPELRVRVSRLERLTETEAPWLWQSRARVGCMTRAGGRLWLTSR